MIKPTKMLFLAPIFAASASSARAAWHQIPMDVDTAAPKKLAATRDGDLLKVQFLFDESSKELHTRRPVVTIDSAAKMRGLRLAFAGVTGLGDNYSGLQDYVKFVVRGKHPVWVALTPQNVWAWGSAVESDYWRYWRASFPGIDPVDFLMLDTTAQMSRIGHTARALDTEKRGEQFDRAKVQNCEARLKQNPSDSGLTREFVMWSDVYGQNILLEFNYEVPSKFRRAREAFQQSLNAMPHDPIARHYLALIRSYCLKHHVGP